MAAILNVIGVVSGLLGIVQFGVDNFGGPDPASSTLKITVGLDVEGGLDNAGGDLPDVRLFNEAGGFLGINNKGDNIVDGTTGEIKVTHQSGEGQQASYALFSANNDAICIAYLSITWSNGDEYGWVADWGRQCGASWYFSNVFVKGSNNKPDCIWIDADGDQPQTGFQVHFPEFVEQDGENTIGDKDTNYFCTAGPPFKYTSDPDPTGITNWVLTKRGERETTHSYSPSRRSNGARMAKTAQHMDYRRSNGTTTGNNKHSHRLVKDNDPGHAVVDLCHSESSSGPDYLNVVHGEFCRMSDKTLWPICSETIQDNCFSNEVDQLIIGGKAARDSPYRDVVDWTSSN
ncbi:hypothetical protein G7046_g427 [Stylonectria norvegica]|nr:hypothetical protein G7046_g427 [Stylonectria norvegica]